MEVDYKKIGFKCGIEIHQQLETHKLFCNCPSIVHDENPDITIERKLRTAAGETGKVDIAAKYEIAKKRKIIYQACSTSSCLVELDEEPPKPINKHALETALQIALLLNAKTVDEIRVMRKTVLDGSNTSGFQRTMLIATDGHIDTSKGLVKIESICLEEEAAKKIETTKDYVKFRLDRLGIPLIEIATDASIQDPEHCKEVASILGMILRSTGKVKRGIGTIRQDVNVSIKSHPRVEIKGFQDLRSIIKIIEFEVKRQLSEKAPKSHVRNATKDLKTVYLRPMPGEARMYPETDVPPIMITEQMLNKIELPELITEKTIQLEKKYNLSPQIAQELIDNKHFESFTNKFKISPQFIARTLIEMPKEISKRYNLSTKNIKSKNYEEIFSQLQKNSIDESAVFEILLDIAKGNTINFNKYKKVSSDSLEKDIQQIIKENKGASPNAIMGLLMKKYRGKADGKKAMEIIKRSTKE
jgi:Glu-tRNA(Gln) amidotransferase subunit E-like FAD-binding protein